MAEKKATKRGPGAAKAKGKDGKVREVLLDASGSTRFITDKNGDRWAIVGVMPEGGLLIRPAKPNEGRAA